MLLVLPSRRKFNKTYSLALKSMKLSARATPFITNQLIKTVRPCAKPFLLITVTSSFSFCFYKKKEVAKHRNIPSDKNVSSHFSHAFTFRLLLSSTITNVFPLIQFSKVTSVGRLMSLSFWNSSSWRALPWFLVVLFTNLSCPSGNLFNYA